MTSLNILERTQGILVGSILTLAVLHFRGVEGIDEMFFWVLGAFLCSQLASAVLKWRRDDASNSKLTGTHNG